MQPQKFDSQKITIFALFLDPVIRGAAQEVIKKLNSNQLQFLEIPSLVKLEELIDPPNLLPRAPDLIICGLVPPSFDLFEVAQVIRLLYPQTVLFYACPGRDGYDRKQLIGNGFTDTFLLPMDHETFKKACIEALNISTQGEIKSYRSVKLIDIQPATVLDFETSIYLPVNNKYIPYSAAGFPIDKERADQLQKHKVDSIFVNLEDMDKFYAYTARSLKNLMKADQISQTEKTERIQTAIRELMTGIFNDSIKDSSFEAGKNVLKDCREIVKVYLNETQHDQKNEWLNKLQKLSSSGKSSYSHASDVSALATLFSMGLGIGNPEELAMAGLLHDIGLADVPFAIQITPEDERTPDQQSVYQRHPEFSVDLLNRKKLTLPPKVLKIILQHHECFNGKGYPRGISEERICPEAQILKLADQFEYFTSVREGKIRMSPNDVLNHYKKELEGDPKQMTIDPIIIKKFLDLFSVK